jgi:DNA-nicking Smr family endonuclease
VKPTPDEEAEGGQPPASDPGAGDRESSHPAVGALAMPRHAMASESAGRRNSDPDAQLFRAAVRDVKPLPAATPPAVERRRPPPPVARFSRADRHAVLEESLDGRSGDPELASGDELVYHRAGVQTSVLKKLRRGQYRVQAEIDLHGLTVAEAKQALREFLATALDQQFRCVRIIHGKGLRSGHRGPVLKGVVSSVLRRVKPVVAYVSARQVDGGTGAVYVLLSN